PTAVVCVPSGPPDRPVAGLAVPSGPALLVAVLLPPKCDTLTPAPALAVRSPAAASRSHALGRARRQPRRRDGVRGPVELARLGGAPPAPGCRRSAGTV